MSDLNEMARLHSAGAIVRHRSPFEDLPTHRNEEELSIDFIKKWAVPFYMRIGHYYDRDWIEGVRNIKQDISPDVCISLLGDFNWRTRLVGAYFSAVKGYEHLIDIIGVHLLKSEVCCVGHIYALTLAFFNKRGCAVFMNSYLDHYLTRPDLYFEQQHVMEAVLYLDKVNGTSNLDRHLGNWQAFVQKRTEMGKQNTVRDFRTDYFEEQVAILRELAKPSAA